MPQGSRVNKTDAPVVLFDGWCPLCVGAIRLLLQRDRRARFRFASLDSAAASELLSGCLAGTEDLEAARGGSTIALIHQGRLHTKSGAVLQIAAELPLPWRVVSLLRLVPRALRDSVYSAVADRRHDVWGQLDSCHRPDPEDEWRFL